MATINVERFAGLNICGFNQMKLQGIFSWRLGQKCQIFMENFHSTCDTCENRESLAQQIVLSLWYNVTALLENVVLIMITLPGDTANAPYHLSSHWFKPSRSVDQYLWSTFNPD